MKSKRILSLLINIKAYGIWLIIGFIIAFILSLLSRYGIPASLKIYSAFPPYSSILLSILSPIVFICTIGFVLYTAKGEGIPGPETFQLVMTLLGILCLTTAFPALFVYWMSSPIAYKKAIKICVFLISLGSSIVFYLINRNRFSNLVEVLGFFTGVCFGPVTVVDILL